MLVTTETTTKKEGRYGIGFKPATRITAESNADVETYIPVSESKQDEEVIERIFVPNQTVETMPTVSKERKPVEQKEITAITMRNKVMLGVYLMIAVVLAVIVAATGIIIGDRSAELASVEGDIKTATVVLNLQEAEIEELMSDASVLERAEMSGMIKPEDITEVPLIPMDNATGYAQSSNFFDSVCDWISGAFGG